MAQFYTNFSGHPSGQQPSGWTKEWNADQDNWLVEHPLGENKLLRQTVGDGPNEAGESLIRRNDVPLVADVEIVTKLRTSDDTDYQNQLYARATGEFTTENGYIAALYNSGTTKYATLDKWVWNDSLGVEEWFSITNLEFDWQVDTWYWMRFRVVGTSLKLKVWGENDPEPAAWDLETTDSDVTDAGMTGVGRYIRDSTKDYEVVGFGTNGDTAPTEPTMPAANLATVVMYGGWGSGYAGQVYGGETSSTLVTPVEIQVTTDAILKNQLTVTVSTDSILRQAYDINVTTDGIIRQQRLLTATTDSILRAALSVQTSTDSLLRAQELLEATTDAKLRKAIAKSVTTDAVLTGGGALIISTDATLKGSVSVSVSTDGTLHQQLEVSATTDGVIRQASTLDIATDATLRKAFSVTAQTDALLRKAFQVSVTTDASIKGGGFRLVSTDAVLHRELQVTVSTDAELYLSFGLTVNTDAVLIYNCKPAVVFTDQDKESTVHTAATKPATAYSIPIKETTGYSEEAKPTTVYEDDDKNVTPYSKC